MEIGNGEEMMNEWGRLSGAGKQLQEIVRTVQEIAARIENEEAPSIGGGTVVVRENAAKVRKADFHLETKVLNGKIEFHFKVTLAT